MDMAQTIRTQGITVPLLGGVVSVPTKQVINLGGRLDVKHALVEMVGGPINRRAIQAASWQAANRISNQQQIKGNPPTQLFIDNSKTKRPDQLLRQIDVFFGQDEAGEDVRPFLDVARGIITTKLTKHIGAVSWRWIWKPRGTQVWATPPPGPIFASLGDKFLLVPVGDVDVLGNISLLNIAYARGFDVVGGQLVRPRTSGKLRRSGFIKAAARAANARVKPRYEIRVQWSSFNKPSEGNVPEGRFNRIRTPSRNYTQGVPVFAFRINIGR